DGELGRRRSTMHVAEIQNAGDGVAFDQNVVIVRIAVNHSRADLTPGGCSSTFVKDENSADRAALGRVGNMLKIMLDPRSAAQVPFELAPGGGMIKGGKGRVESSKSAAQIAQQLFRLDRFRVQKPARQKFEQPYDAAIERLRAAGDARN